MSDNWIHSILAHPDTLQMGAILFMFVLFLAPQKRRAQVAIYAVIFFLTTWIAQIEAAVMELLL